MIEAHSICSSDHEKGFNPTMKYNPSDAAKACNVSVNTVRGWIRDFGEHFTPEARGESGNRLLSDKDLNTLQYIASLRSNGLQRDAIAQRLQETAIGETETLVDVEKPAIALRPTTEAQQALQQAQEAFLSRVRIIDDLQTQINVLQQIKEEVKQSRQRDTLIFALGLTAGIVLAVGLLAVAALLMGR